MNVISSGALRSFLLAFFLFSLVPVAHAGVPLVEPQPIAVPGTITAEQVAAAIKVALSQRGWVVSAEKPGEIEGTLNVRKHYLRESFKYGNGVITIKYLESRELGYEMKGGTAYIHSKFTNWNANLALDVNNEFIRMAAGTK